MRLGRLVGHYFILLGLTSLVWIPLGWALHDAVFIDLSFIIYMWVGWGLLQGRNGYRIGAMVICGIFFVGALAILTVGLLFSPESLSVGNIHRPAPNLLAATVAVIALVFGFPFVALSLPGTAAAFKRPREEVQKPPLWASRLLFPYASALMLSTALAVFFAQSTHRLSLSASTSSVRDASGNLCTTSCARVESEADDKPLYIAWWLLAETNHIQTSRGPLNYSVWIAEREFEPPAHPPGGYFLVPPAEPTIEPNVFLIDRDGTVTAVDRRVTPQSLKRLEDAIEGFTDRDDLLKRIKTALPALKRDD